MSDSCPGSNAALWKQKNATTLAMISRRTQSSTQMHCTASAVTSGYYSVRCPPLERNERRAVLYSYFEVYLPGTHILTARDEDVYLVETKHARIHNEIELFTHP